MGAEVTLSVDESFVRVSLIVFSSACLLSQPRPRWHRDKETELATVAARDASLIGGVRSADD